MRTDTQGNPAVTIIDQQITEKRVELNRLEAARNLLVTQEPSTTRRGRKTTRRFRASSGTAEAPTPRKRGRPKGSKNKPKVATPESTSTPASSNTASE